MQTNSLEQKFLNFINDNNLHTISALNKKKYFLPYKSDKKNIRVFIYATIVEEINTLKIGFRAALLNKNESENVLATLLDLNSRLTTGALALEKDSDIVEYTINYTVEEEETIELDRYERIISYCINLFYDLYDRKIIERENKINE